MPLTSGTKLGPYEIQSPLGRAGTGQRRPWKELHFGVLRKGKAIVVTPDLKYYAYYVPRYSSDLYLVENLR